jgi:hypothetical protein
VAQVTITVKDEKNKRGNTSFFVRYPDLIDAANEDPVGYAQAVLAVVDNMIGGQIVSAGLTTAIPLVAGMNLKPAPAPSSDVEERGVFTFQTTNPEVMPVMSVPTFREDLVLAGTNRINREAAEVAAFIEIMTRPEELPADWAIGMVDERGEFDVTGVRSALEKFRSS